MTDKENLDKLIKQLDVDENIDQNLLQDIQTRLENITSYRLDNHDLEHSKFLIKYANFINKLSKLKSIIIWAAIFVFFYKMFFLDKQHNAQIFAYRFLITIGIIIVSDTILSLIANLLAYYSLRNEINCRRIFKKNAKIFMLEKINYFYAIIAVITFLIIVKVYFLIKAAF